jgi:hypoxia-inducible factor 1 alpha
VRKKIPLIPNSGIENEHEIYSCAQLEAQQQDLSKAIETTAAVAEAQSDTPKVIKKDNIVLGISDLKQQQQRKLSAAEARGNSGTNKSAASKPAIVDKKEESVGQSAVAINPINTIKVNNCEIINRRPRSVTAAIFAQSTVLNPKAAPINATTAATAGAEISHRKSSSTKKSTGTRVFRPSQQQVNATSVTSTIFAPRTKDMNRGYLMFSEDDTGLTSE